jgi:hypothetical protein
MPDRIKLSANLRAWAFSNLSVEMEMTQALATERVIDSAAEERARQFDRDGFIVARRMFSPGQMQDFIDECQSFEGKVRDRAEPNSKGRMQFYSELFRESELVRRFVTQQSLIDFISPITGPDLWLRWDQAVAKGPQSGVFAWHTDEAYDGLTQRHFEVWIALTEMRADNGGLWVIPGSHKRRHRHHRIGNHMVADASPLLDAPSGGKVFVEAEAGDVVLFSSGLLHKTYENTTTKARWAYVAEMLQIGTFDPAVEAPYFVTFRDGKPACEFVDSLACARDPVQIVRTLPIALKHRVVIPLKRSVRSALSARSKTA